MVKGNKFELSIAGSDITVDKIEKSSDDNINYKSLDAATDKERDEKFLELTKKLWKEFAVHGIVRGKDGVIRQEDLEAKCSLALLKVAGIEDAFEKSSLTYVKPEQKSEGKINIGIGGKIGVGVEGKSAYINSLGKDSSAAETTYEMLVEMGLLKKRNSKLRKMVDFTNKVDNAKWPGNKDYFKNSWKTISGLERFVSKDNLLKFFTEDADPNPTRELNSAELEKYGFISKKGKKIENISREREIAAKKSLETLNQMEKNNFIIESDKYGKIVVSIEKGGKEKNIPGDFRAVKAFGCDAFVSWNPKDNRFKISTSAPLDEKFLKQGKRVRDKMWLKPYSDSGELTITLKEILDKLTDGKLKPEGELKKYLENKIVPPKIDDQNKTIEDRAKGMAGSFEYKYLIDQDAAAEESLAELRKALECVNKDFEFPSEGEINLVEEADVFRGLIEAGKDDEAKGFADEIKKKIEAGIVELEKKFEEEKKKKVEEEKKQIEAEKKELDDKIKLAEDQMAVLQSELEKLGEETEEANKKYSEVRERNSNSFNKFKFLFKAEFDLIQVKNEEEGLRLIWGGKYRDHEEKQNEINVLQKELNEMRKKTEELEEKLKAMDAAGAPASPEPAPDENEQNKNRLNAARKEAMDAFAYMKQAEKIWQRAQKKNDSFFRDIKHMVVGTDTLHDDFNEPWKAGKDFQNKEYEYNKKQAAYEKLKKELEGKIEMEKPRSEFENNFETVLADLDSKKKDADYELSWEDKQLGDELKKADKNTSLKDRLSLESVGKRNHIEDKKSALDGSIGFLKKFREAVLRKDRDAAIKAFRNTIANDGSWDEIKDEKFFEAATMHKWRGNRKFEIIFRALHDIMGYDDAKQVAGGKTKARSKIEPKYNETLEQWTARVVDLAVKEIK